MSSNVSDRHHSLIWCPIESRMTSLIECIFHSLYFAFPFLQPLGWHWYQHEQEHEP